MADTIDASARVESAPESALASKIATEELATELLARAETEGVSLVGPGGRLAGLTKRILEAASEGEMTDHVGYQPCDPAGRARGTRVTGHGRRR